MNGKLSAGRGNSAPRPVLFLVLALVLAAGQSYAQDSLFRMLDGHAAVMLLIDADSGVIADANASALAFYGYVRSQLLGMNIDRINMFTAEEVAAERARAAEEKRNYFIFPHRLADGSVRSVEVYSSPVQAPGSGRRLLLSIIHDLRGKHVAEVDQEEYTQRLNLLVAERAHQLASARVLLLGSGSVAAALLVMGLFFAWSIRKQRRSAQALQAALDDRVRLFKELQHRVKNSLAIMTSFVSIESSRLKGEAKAALEGLGNRIATLAALYERMHQTESEGYIDVGEYLKAITEGLCDSMGGSVCAIETDLDSYELDSRRASSVGLIANELLTNAVKHGLQAGGSAVTLSFRHMGEKLVLRVWNDRPPLPAGFSLAALDGFGLLMASELARQLKGTLEWSSEGGTTFSVSFPSVEPLPRQ